MVPGRAQESRKVLKLGRREFRRDLGQKNDSFDRDAVTLSPPSLYSCRDKGRIMNKMTIINHLALHPEVVPVVAKWFSRNGAINVPGRH